MEIKILGGGCANCRELEKRVKKALSELNVRANVVKVTDFSEIGKCVMVTPAVLINDKVMHSGIPLPKVERIKEWLQKL